MGRTSEAEWNILARDLRKEFPRCQYFVITLGPRGVMVVERRANREPKLLPNGRRRKVYDESGCGDVFAARFVWAIFGRHLTLDASVALALDAAQTMLGRLQPHLPTFGGRTFPRRRGSL